MTIDWNVIVTVSGPHLGPALRLLEPYGRIRRTGFYNVVVLEVEDLDVFLERFREDWTAARDVRDRLRHVFPARRVFEFADGDELVRRASELARDWLPRLAGRSFHVRLHRRGLEGAVVTQEIERRVGRALLEELERRGETARIEFANPDEVVDLGTVGRRAGLAIWSREERARYPFLPAG